MKLQFTLMAGVVLAHTWAGCYAEQAHPLTEYKLPLRFEANYGQADSRARFISRSGGYSLFLTKQEAVLRVAQRRGKSKVSVAVVRMRPVGARADVAVEGEARLPGVSNYLSGADSVKWRTGVPQYGRVRYRGIYPGIDLVYYGQGRQLEYDVIVAPGADPSAAQFVVEGADRMRLDRNGDLVLETRAGEIRHRCPNIFQESGGQRRPVKGRFALSGNRVRFEVEEYDRNQALTIDPALQYATYLGGERNETVTGIAVDSAGNAYVTGYTDSAGFPTTTGSYDVACGTDGNCNGGGEYNRDVFVTKINSTGTALVYSTFIGGRKNETASQIIVDAAGNAYIAGMTDSPDFPVTAGGYGGGATGFFVVKLNPSGSAPVFTVRWRYVDYNPRIAIDGTGAVYFADRVYSGTSLPTTAGAFQRVARGYYDAYVAKLNAAGTMLDYCTWLGGSGVDTVTGLTVDAAGNAIVRGNSSSLDFPVTANSYKPVYPTGAQNAGFVAKFNASGSALVFGTFTDTYGNSSSVATDSQQQIYVSDNNKVFRLSADGSAQGFVHSASGSLYIDAGDNVYLHSPQSVSRVTNSGVELLYTTNLTLIWDYYSPITALDPATNLYVASSGSSGATMPTPGAVQQQRPGSSDLFIARINRAGGQIRFFPTAVDAIVPPGTASGTAITKRVWVLSDGTPHPVEVPFSAAVTGGSWLSTLPSSGTALPQSRAGSATLSLSVGGVAAGSYSGALTVTSAGAENSPASLPVSLLATSAPFVDFSSSYPELTFQHVLGGATPPAQSVYVYTRNSGTAAFTVASSAGWLSVTPASGTGSGYLTVSVNPSGLAAGNYFGTIDLTTTGVGTTSLPVRLSITQPQLSASPGSLSFTQTQNKPAPAAQDLTLSGSGNFTAAVSGGTWLTLSQSSGTLPATLSLSVNAAGLSPGTYRANVIVSSASLGSITIPVTFVLIPPNQLTVSPAALNFSYWPGATAQSQSVSISSDPSVNWSAFASSTGNWLSAVPSGGSTPGTLTVSVNPSGLAEGTHTGTISVVATDVANSPQTITVKLVVAASCPVTASPSSLTFATSPGVAPPAQSVSVSDPGGKSFTAAASATWLAVAPASGTMPTSLSVSVNPAGLGVGNYSGSVTVQVTRQDNTVFPLTIPVTLSVVQQNELRVTPGTLTFYAWAGTPVAIGGSRITMGPNASGSCAVGTADVPWLPASLYICPYIPIDLSPSVWNLPPGQYTGRLTFTSDSASNGPQTVTVNLTVLPSPPVSLTPASISFQYQGGAKPAPQTLSVTSPSATAFTASVTGGQWLSVSPTSGTTPGTLTLTADPTGLAAGTHTANVIVSVAYGGVTLPVSVPVTLTVGQPQLQVSGLDPYYPPGLSFTWDPAGAPPQPKVLTVSSSDESIVQTITTTVWTDSGGNWLEVLPATGSTPLSARVSIKTDGLGVGTYMGHISFASDKAGNSPQVITVILRVGSVLRAGTPSLVFRYLPGGAAPDAQTVSIESGGTAMQFTSATAPVTSWLRLAPASGTTPADVKFSVDATGLPPGIYSTQVQFSSPTATGSQAYVLVQLEVGPRMTFSPGSVSFTAEPGSTAPQSQTVSLTAGGASLNYRIMGSVAKWLTVTPSAGVTPATLTLTANPSGLSAGEYSASVIVSAPDSADQSRTLQVSLRVGAKLAASQTSLSFQSAVYGPLQYSQPIAISTGATSMPFSAWASAAGGWLSVNPQAGTTPSAIVATISPSGLVPGNYTGTISVSATDIINTITIPVSLTVSGAGAATLSVLPPALSFTQQLNGAAPPAQMLTVTSPAPAPITAAATGGTWLSVAPAQGISPLNVQVSVNAAGLAAGVYTAYVSLSSNGVVAQTVPVTLTVQEGPQLLLSASSLSFAAAPGGSAPPSQTVDVTSTGRAIAYRATNSAAWLSVTPASGRTGSQISISVNPAAAGPGSYEGTISVSSDEPGVVAKNIAVRLTVSSLPQLTVSPTAINVVYTVGDDPPDPASLVVFSDARLPYTVQAASSGWLSASRTSGGVPDFLEVAVDPDGLKPGVYAGTLTVASSGAANSPQVVTVKFTVKAPEPVVSPGGVVNTASYLYGAIAPGSLISIFGENLAPGTMNAEASPWPTTLNRVSVTINGIAAPLYYVSPDQINAQVPFEIPIGLGRLVVTVDGRSSMAAVFPITSASPGIFYSSATRTAVQNADYSTNSAENPAPVGSVVLAYLTGQGKLDMALASGVPAPESPLRRPALPVHAVINDREAEVLFGGMAPGLVGVMQVNLRIPELAPGEHLLRISVGGVSSNSVPVNVSAAPVSE